MPEIPLGSEVSREISDFFPHVMGKFGHIEDATCNVSNEGGFVWVKLKDGRTARMTFELRIELPKIQDATTLLDTE